MPNNRDYFQSHHSRSPGGGGVTGFQKVPSSSDYATKRSTRSQGGESRQAWKEVAKTRKREKRAWEQQQATLAASLDWKAMRSLHHAKTHRGLAPTIAGRCTGNKSWKKKHEGIFAKPRPINSTARILELQRQLRWKCKHTPWVPFQHQELAHTSSTWAKNKSTGPDGSSHEAAKALLAEPLWGDKILYVLNDTFYVAQVPDSVDQGITVFLPKVPQPLHWGETGPITLSSGELHFPRRARLPSTTFGRCMFRCCWRRRRS